MTSLLNLAVGTGTAGKCSDIAIGPARTTDLTARRRAVVEGAKYS